MSMESSVPLLNAWVKPAATAETRPAVPLADACAETNARLYVDH